MTVEAPPVRKEFRCWKCDRKLFEEEGTIKVVGGKLIVKCRGCGAKNGYPRLTDTTA